MSSENARTLGQKKAEHLAALKEAAREFRTAEAKFQAAEETLNAAVKAATRLGGFGNLTWDEVSEILDVPRSTAHRRYNPPAPKQRTPPVARRGGALPATKQPEGRPTTPRASRG